MTHAVHINFFDSTSSSSFETLPDALRYYAEIIETLHLVENTVCSVTLRKDGQVTHVFRPEI